MTDTIDEAVEQEAAVITEREISLTEHYRTGYPKARIEPYRRHHDTVEAIKFFDLSREDKEEEMRAFGVRRYSANGWAPRTISGPGAQMMTKEGKNYMFSVTRDYDFGTAIVEVKNLDT